MVLVLLFVSPYTYAQANDCIEENGEEWCESLDQCVVTQYEIQDDARVDFGDLNADGCYDFEELCVSLNNECVLTQWEIGEEENDDKG